MAEATSTFELPPPGIPGVGQFLYRFEDVLGFTVLGRLTSEPDSEHVYWENNGVQLAKCLIVKKTPQGWWVRKVECAYLTKTRHWVSEGDGKRYAYPTVQGAWESYRRRKVKQISILEKQLRITKDRLRGHESKKPEDYE